MQYILGICNFIFSVLFTIEMVLKLIGLGLTEYFTNFWTILDFFIVFVSNILLLMAIMTKYSVKAFKHEHGLKKFISLFSEIRNECIDKTSVSFENNN